MSTLTTKRVGARLWNDKQDYTVQLNLEVRELRGQNFFPDDYCVVRASLLGGIAVEDDTYNLEYMFNGRQENARVRVIKGC